MWNLVLKDTVEGYQGKKPDALQSIHTLNSQYILKKVVQFNPKVKTLKLHNNCKNIKSFLSNNKYNI